MASESGDRTFHKILVEVYKNGSSKNIDVVGEKKKHFQDLLHRAHDALKSKKFSEAKGSYWNIIEFLDADRYPDELNLSADVYYSIKCCFCYSCLMDVYADTKWDHIFSDIVKELSEKHGRELFPKFLQVLLFFHKKNWAMTLQWCNAVETHQETIEQQMSSADTSETATDVPLPNKPRIVAEVEVYEEKALFNYWTKLASSRLAKSKGDKYQLLIKAIGIIMKLLDMDTKFFESLFRDEEMPFMGISNNYSTGDQELVPYDNCMKKEIKNCIGDKDQPDKISIEKILVKLIETFTKVHNCSYINSVESRVFNKIEEIGDIVTQGDLRSMDNGAGENINAVNTQTQTDKSETESRSVQTDIIKAKNVEVTTQTQRGLKLGRCIQTDTIKSKNVDVQVNFDVQLINTMVDIKNKLLVTQEKKDESILKLNKKLCEANEKANKEFVKRKSQEEDYNRKHAKLEVQLNKLREQVGESKNQYEREKEKNVALQKQLFELFGEKYNTQRHVYKIFEKKSSFMVSYLQDLLHSLTPNSIPSKPTIQQNITTWKGHQKSIKKELDQLNEFYLKVSLEMFNSQNISSQNISTVTWPDIPNFPTDEDNIIFTSFKPAIKNIIDVEESMLQKYNTTATVQTPIQPYSPLAQNNPYAIRPQYPFQNSTFFVGPRLVYPTLQQPISLATTNAPLPPQIQMINTNRVSYETASYMAQSLPGQVAPINAQFNTTTDSLRTLDAGEESAKISIPPTIWVAASTSSGPSGLNNKTSKKSDRKYQEKEKIIFEYVIENCPNVTEEDVTMALLQVVNNNKGTLAKLPKDKIVQEVKMVLGMKKQSAWVTPKSPHVEWENDNAEPTCSICFEEFCLKETYTLRCKHAYHKECIKKWLKTSSVCPICRVHSVIDDEFPPLH